MKYTFLLLLFLPLLGCVSNEVGEQLDLDAPRAAKKEHVHQHQGVDRPDPYQWLSDKTDPEVVAHLEKENEYTEAYLAPTEALQETLYEELIARIMNLFQPRIMGIGIMLGTKRAMNTPFIAEKKSLWIALKKSFLM